MTGRADERLLDEDDPLRDGAAVATRLLAIDEAEAIRDALWESGIESRRRLVKPGTVEGPRRDPTLESEYSLLRPSWNVIVAPEDLARARALAEEELGVDVDGREDTAVALGEAPPPPTTVLVRLPWDDAWALVDRLASAGIHAAVGNPSGTGSIEEQEVAVLVLAEDLARARSVSRDPAAEPLP